MVRPRPYCSFVAVLLCVLAGCADDPVEAEPTGPHILKLNT